MSQVTPIQVKPITKIMSSFFAVKKTDVVTPSSSLQNLEEKDDNKLACVEIKLSTGIADGFNNDTLATPLMSQSNQHMVTPSSEAVYEIDRLITNDDAVNLTTKRSVIDDDIVRDPKMTLFKDKTVAPTTVNLSNVSTMPPLPPRFKETKKSKKPTPSKKEITTPTVTLNEDGSEVMSDPIIEGAEIKTPKKRVYKPKVVAVTPSDGDAVADGADTMDGATTPGMPSAKKARKPNAKKAAPVVADGIAAVGSESVEDGTAVTLVTEEDVDDIDKMELEENSTSAQDSAPAESQSDSVEIEVRTEITTTPAKKQPRKKNNALKALESYNNTGGKEVMAEKRVAVQVDYTDSSLNVIDEAYSKSPAAKTSSVATSVVNAFFTAGDGSTSLSFDSIAPSVAGHVTTTSAVAAAVALEKVLRELPAEVVAKIAASRDRMSALMGEMLALEAQADLCDRNLDLDQAMADLAQFVTSAVKEVAVVASSDEKIGEEVEPVEAVQTTDSQEEQVAAVAASPSSPQVFAAPVVATAVAPVASLGDQIDLLIRTVIARSLQGVSLNKADAAQLMLETLSTAVERINAACEEITQISGADAVSAVLTDIEDIAVRAVVERQQRVLRVIADDSTEAAKMVELLFTRKNYGNPMCKGPTDTCTEAAAGWRLVVNSPVRYLTKSGQTVLREVTSVRTRYQTAMKCVAKVVENLSNEACSASALAASEEKLSKAVLDVDKAKEKRKEGETKRNAIAAEKALKDAEKEAKRREKEEADVKKKQTAAEKAAAALANKEAAALLKASQPASAEKEKKVHVPTEKELKAAALLEKQKNGFKGFFGAAPKPAGATNAAAPIKPGHSAASSSNSKGSLKPLAPIVFTASAPVFATNSSSNDDEVVLVERTTSADGDILSITSNIASTSMKVDEEVQIVPTAKSQTLVDFETQLNCGMSTSEIMQAYRSSSDSRAPKTKKHKRRGSVKLYVTVHLGNPNANTNAFNQDNDETYSEIRERKVDKKMRTLCFAEDHRPAYFGTVTKKSAIISGRRPCARDEELVNYDFDSEGEWEEEVEGEDIGDSGDEMDSEDGDRNAANELVYDDYFVRDNDYGSDADSDCDADMNATAVHSGREREEVLGVRFVTSSHRVSFPLSADSSAVQSSGGLKSYRIAENASSSSSSSPVSIAFSACPDRDNDTQRLSQYSAVLFPTLAGGGVNVAPYLGDAGATTTSSSGETTASSAKKAPKKRKAADSTDTTSSAATETASVEASSTPTEEVDASGKCKTFDESKLAEFVQLVHGSKDGADKLVGQFHSETAPHVPKTQIKKRLLEITTKAKHAEGHGSARWVVKEEVFASLNQTAGEVVFTPLKKKKARIEPTKVADSAVVVTVSGFINTFMPPELLVAPSVVSSSSSSSSTEVAVVSSTTVPATPKKESKPASATQSNKITAFVKPSTASSSSTPLSGTTATSASPPTKVTTSPFAASSSAPVNILVAKKKKSPKKDASVSVAVAAPSVVSSPSSGAKSTPEVIELL